MSIRNVKRAMAWLSQSRSYDELKKKAKEIQSHIDRCGEEHPSASDFKSALFLVKEAIVAIEVKGAHAQRGFDFEMPSNTVFKQKAINPEHCRGKDKRYTEYAKKMRSLA